MALKSVLNKLFSTKPQDESIQNTDRRLPRERTIVSWLDFHPDMVHGTICVQDGKVIVTDPQNDGSYATILVPENPLIRIFVDGERVFEEVVVTRSNRIDVEFSSGEPAVSYEAIVSDDELQVSIRAKVVQGRKLSLKDSEPCRQLELDIEESYTDPSRSSPEEILNILSKNGYCGIIDYDAVNRLCQVTHSMEVVVLRGTASIQGHPGKLRASQSFSLEHDSFLHLNRSSVVSIGTTVAVLEPEVVGTVGQNVYGVVIPIKNKATQTVPNLGYGVIRVNQDIVAIREGRPRFTRHWLDVIPERVVHADIAAEQGIVSFDGNMVVHGTIRDGATVKVSGTITVYGNIEQSSVFAGQGVLVQGGILGSRVVAGHQQIVYENLQNLLEKLIPQLKRFHEEYLLMVAHAIKRFNAHVTIPKIPALLFEKRHESLEQMLKVFVDEYANDLSEFDNLYRELRNLIVLSWTGEHRFQVVQKDIELLFEKLEIFRNHIRELPKEVPVIRVEHVASSSVQSIGNILIMKNGHSSTLESGRTVSVHKSFRGGFIVAHKSVYVGELGNPSGVETSVHVDDPSGVIRVKLNHINTLLEVNGRRSRAYNTEREIRFVGV